MEKTYKVHIVCWDGVEYDRHTTKEEIDKQREAGHLVDNGHHRITFDFLNK